MAPPEPRPRTLPATVSAVRMREILGGLYSATSRLSELTEQLLDLSRIDAGVVPLETVQALIHLTVRRGADFAHRQCIVRHAPLLESPV